MQEISWSLGLDYIYVYTYKISRSITFSQSLNSYKILYPTKTVGILYNKIMLTTIILHDHYDHIQISIHTHMHIRVYDINYQLENISSMFHKYKYKLFHVEHIKINPPCSTLFSIIPSGQSSYPIQIYHTHILTQHRPSWSL